VPDTVEAMTFPLATKIGTKKQAARLFGDWVAAKGGIRPFWGDIVCPTLPWGHLRFSALSCYNTPFGNFFPQDSWMKRPCRWPVHKLEVIQNRRFAVCVFQFAVHPELET